MIRYLIMDIDGSLTDGKIYMGPNGEAMKAFSIKDGMVTNIFLKPNGIIPIVITARKSLIVENRCNELGIKEVYQGKLDKLATLKEIVGANGLSSCAYFGDDILDLTCMNSIKEAGGIIACPADSVREVKAISDYVCVSKAGEGALREFTEWLISDKNKSNDIKHRIEFAVNYLKNLKISEDDVEKKICVNDDFYYTLLSYNTKPTEECKIESHRKYIDIQIMISGEEGMDFIDISRLTLKEKYDEQKDVMFWNESDRMNKTTLVVGDCIVLYPEIAHRGAQNIQGTKHVLKIVGKVKL